VGGWEASPIASYWALYRFTSKVSSPSRGQSTAYNCGHVDSQVRGPLSRVDGLAERERHSPVGARALDDANKERAPGLAYLAQ